MPSERSPLGFLSIGKDYAELLRFLRTGDVRPALFILPASLALLVAAFESLGVYLMIPLVKGMMALDFAFLYDDPALKPVFSLLLGESRPSTSVIFASLVLAIFLSFVAKNASQYASSVSVAFIVRRFANNLRKKILSNCLTYGKAYFDRVNAGHLHNVTVNITSNVAFRLTDLQQLFAWLFILVAYLGMMLYISWKLTLFVMLVFPVLNYSLARIISKIRVSSSAYAKFHAEMGRRVHNIFACIPLVKAYSQEATESSAFAKMSDDVAKMEFEIDRRLLLVQPVQETILLGLILLLISFMAFIVSREGTAQVPGFLIFFYIIRRASVAFGVLNSMKASLATVSGPIAEISAVLEEGESRRIPEGSERFPGLATAIEFRNLRYSYSSGRQILTGLSFTVEKGKMTAVVGPSGAGKTTVISLLCRFYDAPPETIFLDGKDIRAFTTDSVRASIALVGQDPVLFNDTLRANVAYGLSPTPSDAEIDRALAKARLKDLLAKLPAGLGTVIGDRGVQLSGGERQRISIARAILKNPEILILDEATSSLDSKTEALIQEAIDEIVCSKTSIVIAHRLATIKRADMIVVLDHGRVTESGPMEPLLRRNGTFRQLWEAQKFH